MSLIRCLDLIDSYCAPLALRDTTLFDPLTLSFPPFVDEVEDLSLSLDLLNPYRNPLDLFDEATDLIQIEKTPSCYTYRRIRQPAFPLQYLCDRVSALEWRFDRLARAGAIDSERKYSWTAEVKGPGERKYKWETEIDGKDERKYKWAAEVEGPADRKYKWTAEIKGERRKKAKNEEEEVVVVRRKPERKNYKWTAEVKAVREDGDVSRKYTFKTLSRDESECSKSGKKEKEKEKEKKGKKEKKKDENKSRVVEIEDEPDEQGAVVLRQAFYRRAGALKNDKGKKKELSPQDAAVVIQMTFRAYLIRRSKALRALRDLAVAKTKLKEIRAQFNNFNYRRHIARDAEERQKFSEKIIVLLLTVDAIESVDMMVRAAKRSMVDELEAMLDMVDPQPQKSLSMRRRTFDMPDSVIRKEIADGVTQIVQMLENEE